MLEYQRGTSMSRVHFILAYLTCFKFINALSYRKLSIVGVSQITGQKSWLMMKGDSLILEGPAAFIERKSRPPHVGIPRKRMDLPFAVQLMRTSYSVADELEFVAMDEFQKDFFLFRQSEWEDYRDYHPTVMQGDLADPLYFDFISFAQYAVIADKIRKGKQQFVEKFGVEGETQVIRREPRYENNDILPLVHSQMVGDKLIDFMFEKYPASILPPRALSQPLEDINTLIGYLQLILDIFAINLYCLSAEISRLPTASTDAAYDAESVGPFGRSRSQSMNPKKPILGLAKVSVKAPANLWSQQVLKRRKDVPLNDFEVKALQSLARRYGYEINTVSSDVFNQIDVIHVLSISKI